MIITPCELAVRDILPAIRAMIVLELRDRGLKQKEIANKLGLTQPAVSYYLNKRRAKKFRVFKEEEELNSAVNDIAERIIRSEMSWKDLSDVFCELCAIARVKIYGMADSDIRHSPQELKKFFRMD